MHYTTLTDEELVERAFELAHEEDEEARVAVLEEIVERFAPGLARLLAFAGLEGNGRELDPVLAGMESRAEVRRLEAQLRDGS